MKKVIILFLSLLLLTGCSTEDTKSAAEPGLLSQDKILTSFENYDIDLYNFTMGKTIGFYIASPVPLENNLEINIDVTTPYTWELVLQEPEKLYENNNMGIKGHIMSYFTYVNYKKYDFQKLIKLENKAYDNTGQVIDKEAAEEYDKYLNLYMDEYDEFIQKDYYKNCYYYGVGLSFDMSKGIGKNESFEEIEMVVDSKKYNFNIGRVTLDYTTTLSGSFGEYLSPQTIQVDGKKIIPNTKGLMKIEDFTYDCNEELTLKGIRILDDSIEIDKVSLVIEENGITLDKKYENGQDLVLKKNSKVTPIIIMRDKNFIATPNYSTIIYLILDYEYMGEIYSTRVEAQYIVRHDFGEMIAIGDGIDLISYYDKYDFPYNGGIE